MRGVSPLDPELLQSITARAKKQIRARMRTMRQAYPAHVIAQKSEALIERLAALPVVAEARSFALFAAMQERREVDLQTLAERLLTQKKRLYYPFMDRNAAGGFTTGFRSVAALTDLTERGQRFVEPPQDAEVAKPGDVDVVLVPALAAAADGHRIGYGAGYYDATLGDVAPPAKVVIVCFDFQLLAELPHEAHDKAGDYVVTDVRTLAM